MLFISLEFDHLIKTEYFVEEGCITFQLYQKNTEGLYFNVCLNGETSKWGYATKIDNGIDTGDIITQRIFNDGY